MAQVGIIPVSANTLTVLAITGYRLKVLMNPFAETSTKSAKIGIAVIWGIAFIPTIIFAAYHSKSEFHEENGRCLSDIYDNDAARIPVMMCVGLIVLLPLFAITFFNVILSCIAIRYSRRRAEEQTNYRALVMVCFLSGLFIVSWTPYVVFTFLKMKSPSVPAALDLLAFHCIFINSFGNPILYTITNKRFGEYVKGLLMSVLCAFKKDEGDSVNSSAMATTKSTGQDTPGAGGQ
jgi:MFS family permease